MTWPTEDDVTAVARILFLSITAHEDAAAVVGLDWSRVPAATRAPWESTARRIVEQVAPHVAALVRAERAEALRDAADALEVLVDDQHPDALNPDQWLRDRAEAEEADR